jgi:hypothetical protein
VPTLIKRTPDGRPNLYLHAGEVKGYGTVEWENPYWYPVEERMASMYASKHPPRTRDLWLWGRPDEALLAFWDGDDWEEEDGEEEDCENSEPCGGDEICPLRSSTINQAPSIHRATSIEKNRLRLAWERRAPGY